MGCSYSNEELVTEGVGQPPATTGDYQPPDRDFAMMLLKENQGKGVYVTFVLKALSCCAWGG